MLRHALISLVLLLFLAGTAMADPVHVGTVTEIVDGDTLFIDPPYGDGAQIRLVGIQAPKLPLGRAGFPTWPLAPEAKDALADMTLGKQVALSFGGARRDRYGRWLAHLHVVTDGIAGSWVQGEMLRRGLARVYSFPDNRALVAEMLAAETEARAANRGIWSDPHYAIRNPDPGVLLPLTNTFQLIEGRVVEAVEVNGTVYLNFGADWRSDFTVSIARKYMKNFEGAGIDPLVYQGQSIRVRGWITKRNGPMINATHPEQIEDLAR